MEKGNVIRALETARTRWLLHAPLPRSYSDYAGRKIFRFLMTVHGLGAFALITIGVIFTKWRTARSVMIPLALPGIVAGSVFTFSLTLGDYITPLLVGGTKANFIGNVIYTNIGIANNVPFAAAMAIVPIVIMAIYLLCARALGALEAV